MAREGKTKVRPCKEEAANGGKAKDYSEQGRRERDEA